MSVQRAIFSKNQSLPPYSKTHLLSPTYFSINWYNMYLRASAAAAKSLQSCPTLCNPIDSSPPGSPIPGIQGKNTEVGCHFLVQCMKVKSEYLIHVNNYVHLCTFELIENSIFCSQDEIRLFKIILGTQAQQQV